ncbi:MAG: hypothetical protein GY928_19675 [Colwellia sp.]|nr:hypothetical protein [Colwellia sp.]
MTEHNSIKLPIISTPANENDLLKSSALLGLVLGVYFMLNVISSWFLPLKEDYQLFTNSLTFLIVVILIMVLVYWVLTLVAAKKLPQSTYLFGVYKDEYFNHINNKGYKWAFNLAIMLLFSLVFIDSYSSIFNTVSIADFSMFIMGFIFVAHALPVLFLLRGEAQDEQ